VVLMQGKKLVQQLKISLPPHAGVATLGIVFVGRDPDSLKFIEIKRKRAAEYGIATKLIELEESSHEREVVAALDSFNTDSAISGVIVQLPLPTHLDRERILAVLAPVKDVDGLTSQGAYLSPMVQAVEALCKEYTVDLHGKKIAVIGAGPLVGQPITQWLHDQRLEPVVIDDSTQDPDSLIRHADIIIAGTGQPILSSHNTQSGQVIFNCSGKDVADENALSVQALTPAVGGIGPLTVHFLLANTLQAAERQK
jgi:methylenetetrahydrofolate dehydrogenase (NADP+)/methenyltetrahydrofolate cyclohydrolase